jgi:hypothetical protein
VKKSEAQANRASKKARIRQHANGGDMSKGRRREDFKGGNPDVGKATQIQPGEVRNPTGRPRRLPITDRYRELLERTIDDELAKCLGLDKKLAKQVIGMKVADAIVMNTARIGIKGEKFAVLAVKEIREPIEGKAVMRIAGPDGEPLVPHQLTVNFIKRGEKK